MYQNSFSSLEISFNNFIEANEREKYLETQKLVEGFSKDEKHISKVKERINKSLNDYWYFDKIYFPKSFYEDYSNPNQMIKDIVNISLIPGYHLVIGPRKHGKTITGKKLLLWLTITNKINIAGVYSETINKSSSILKDLYKLCINNDKLLFDFNIKFQEANSDNLAFTTEYNKKISMKFIGSFSEGRSVRGFTRLFGRPKFLLADDIETNQSSFTQSAIDNRISKLSETYNSLSEDSIFLIFANDFNSNSAVHLLRLQYEQNLLPDNFKVYVYKAWQDNNKPLWDSKYKVKTEEELKSIINPLNESEWQSDFQANPVPPEGYYFKRDYYNELNCTDNDIKGVIYCDPNLSKKGKGDTTAIVKLVYSYKLDKYFVTDAICKSYSDSNELLNDFLEMKDKNIVALAFDGNVNQESTWTQHIRNYTYLNQMPYPIIEYKKYRVDDLAKNLQLIYNAGKLFFPEGFSKSEYGKRFLSQFFSFVGKKNNKQDDAPDALICALEFINERNLTRRNINKVKTFKDYYSL